MKKILMMVLTIFVLVIGVASASYLNTQGAATTAGTLGQLTETSAGTNYAQGSNMTEVNLSNTMSTVKWAGYIGEVSVSLQLGSSTDVLYDFGAAETDVASVFASTDQNFDWTGLAVGVPSAMDTAWGFDSGDADAAQDSNVYGANTVTIAEISNVPYVNLTAYEPNDKNLTHYASGIFNDGNDVIEDDYAFGVDVIVNQYAYDNSTQIDYELFLPANSSVSPTQKLQYYFFLALS